VLELRELQLDAVGVQVYLCPRCFDLLRDRRSALIDAVAKVVDA
jgi:hypothetical protein